VAGRTQRSLVFKVNKASLPHARKMLFMQMTFDFVRDEKQSCLLLAKNEALKKLESDEHLTTWQELVNRYYPSYKVLDVGVHDLLLKRRNEN